jgi:hypothetical protein
MIRETTAKVPHVQGKSAGQIRELTEQLGHEGDGVYGNEKFCMRRKRPGFPALGMMEIGEV